MSVVRDAFVLLLVGVVGLVLVVSVVVGLVVAEVEDFVVLVFDVSVEDEDVVVVLLVLIPV